MIQSKNKSIKYIGEFLAFDRKRILFEVFLESQFKYCPLIWMFYSRRTTKRITKLHERAFRLVYDDYETSISDLLAIDSSFTVHHTITQTLLLEVYKIKHKLSENCLKGLFSTVNANYNLHSQSDFKVPGINTIFYDANLIRHFGSVI